MRDALVYFITALLLGIVLTGFMPLDAAEPTEPTGVTAVAKEKVPDHPELAHTYADAILFPRMMAALFEFQFKHPQDRKTAFDHVRVLDADAPADRARFKAAIAAVDKWRAALKKDGY